VIKPYSTEPTSSRLDDHQVRIIDMCLRLHGQLCPQEMLTFHETLEKFFHKNFGEEIRRLSFDAPTERGIATSLRPPDASSYTSSLADAPSIVPSSNASASRAPFAIPPLHLPGPSITPPQSPATSFAGSALQPTRLQKHMAHLARHGMNAVSSGPGEGADGGIHRSDSLSVGSHQGSFVNVTGTAGPSATNSGASLAGSKNGSLKGRFSRLGSLSFGRRDGIAS
jgi:hypothetical protein